jgi:hypothetical protein
LIKPHQKVLGLIQNADRSLSDESYGESVLEDHVPIDQNRLN